MAKTQPIDRKHSMCLQGTAFPLADANGNCVSFIDTAGNVQAHYVYDAFGGTVSSDGDMADAFRFRFSSKYLDDETWLYYYGYRYLPPIGRWISRDPIWEHSWWARRRGGRLESLYASSVAEMLGRQGGGNVYGFVLNSPFDAFDPIGLKDCKFNKALGKCARAKPPPYNPDDYANMECGGVENWEDVPEDPAYGIQFFKISCPFTPACITHDRCYWTCNSVRSDCDNQFYLDMLATCKGCWEKSFSSWNPIGWVWLGDCYAIALTYYGGVKAGGWYDYEKYAQPDACEECCCEGGAK